MTLNEPSDNWVAMATSCISDPDTNRPLAGILVINEAFVKNGGSQNTKSEIGFLKDTNTIIHELTHVMGFSEDSFPDWIDNLGNLRGTKKILGNCTINGKVKKGIILQPLVDYARQYFGCSNITCLPVEDEGGDGTAISHWEKVIFGDELMTGSINIYMPASKFTWLLLEQTGWYAPQYEYAELYAIGKNRGCEYFFQHCNASEKFPEYCYIESKSECSFDRNYKAICDNNFLANGCFLQVPFDILDNYNLLGSSCNEDIYSSQIQTLEQYGQTSKCFASNIFKSGHSSSITNQCYSYTCDDQGQLKIKVGKQMLLCQEGVDKVEYNDGTYKGNLTCPTNIGQICDTISDSCEDYCTNKGYCGNGRCECRAGMLGKTCDSYSLSTSTTSSSQSGYNLQFMIQLGVILLFFILQGI